jgi:hypothetical protein
VTNDWTRRLDATGDAIERGLDGIERRFGRHSAGSLLLGVLLAIGAIAGGLAAFIVVFVALVSVFA